MRLYPENACLAFGRQQPILVTGGTAPYTFQVAVGGGSVINADGVVGTALFVAPDESDTSVVIARDSLGEEAEIEIVTGTPLELVCDILQRELGLQEGRVYLWNQKINAPTDDGLWIAVGVQGTKPFSSVNQMEEIAGILHEVQTTNILDRLSIDLVSKGPVARDQRADVILALKSVYAQQQMAQNSFTVFPLTQNFVNLSEIDGAAIPYRFSLSVALQYAYKRTKPVPYYDTFDEPSLVVDP